MIAAKLLHRRKLAADVAKQREDEIRFLLDSLTESILHEIIDIFIRDISKKWIMYVSIKGVLWMKTLLQIQFVLWNFSGSQEWYLWILGSYQFMS